jgi:glycosyltransferase involved in cell wall biosynthesis
MGRNTFHITVCICTYKRNKYLTKLVNALQDLVTDELFEYSIVIVDNAPKESAKQTVKNLEKRSSSPLFYFHEPEQNIALARNKAVSNAAGKFIAFIDDDELPSRHWLINLYKTCRDFHADGALGPVIPRYEGEPPKWVVRGKFYERPSHITGEVLDWMNTRTGNVLLRKEIFDTNENFFRRQFGSGGEDRDFFRRMIAKGFRFVWCAEAPVYEAVPAVRYSRSFMLRRALLRGQLPHFTIVDYLKSIIAIPLYTSSLPFLLIGGQHLFMKYLVKIFDHIGRLLFLLGINVIKESYVVE